MARATTRAANVASKVKTMCHSASTEVGVIVIHVVLIVVLVRVVVVVVVVVAVQAGVCTCLDMVILATCTFFTGCTACSMYRESDRSCRHGCIVYLVAQTKAWYSKLGLLPQCHTSSCLE